MEYLCEIATIVNLRFQRGFCFDLVLGSTPVYRYPNEGGILNVIVMICYSNFIFPPRSLPAQTTPKAAEGRFPTRLDSGALFHTKHVARLMRHRHIMDTEKIICIYIYI